MFADNGEVLHGVTNPRYVSTVDDIDQWTLTNSLNLHRPLHRVTLEYVSGTCMLASARKRGWTAQVGGALTGPLWYDTDENLLVAQAAPSRTYVHRKDPFWLWDASGTYPLTRLVRLRATVTTLLDANVHPTFIAVDERPYLSDPRFSNGDSAAINRSPNGRTTAAQTTPNSATPGAALYSHGSRVSTLSSSVTSRAATRTAFEPAQSGADHAS